MAHVRIGAPLGPSRSAVAWVLKGQTHMPSGWRCGLSSHLQNDSTLDVAWKRRVLNNNPVMNGTIWRIWGVSFLKGTPPAKKKGRNGRPVGFR